MSLPLSHHCNILILIGYEKDGLRAEDGNPAEAIVDSDRWVIHFTELSEERYNRNTFRNMDADLNFVRVEGDSCTIQIVKRGAQKLEAPGRDVAVVKHHYFEIPNEPGLGGTVIRRKVLDLKKTVKRKGTLQVDFRLDDQHTKIRIQISPDNTWSTLNVSGLARMRGKGVEMW